MRVVFQPNNQCAATLTTLIVAVIVLPLLIFSSQEKLVKYMIWDSILYGGVMSLFMFFVLLIIALIVILCIVRHSRDHDVTQLATYIICLLGISFILIVIFLGICATRATHPTVSE